MIYEKKKYSNIEKSDNMSKKTILGIKINYDFKDTNSDTTIVLLHGWGQNIKMMEPIAKKFKDKYNILSIDLAGFGESEEPDSSWSIYEYTDCLRELIESLKLKKVIIVGHSFGGRIALVYSSKYKVEKLICFASPYCKEITKLPLKNKIYKQIKKIKCLNWLSKIMQNKIGSTDYKNASQVMKGVLVKAVNQDLTEDVKNIKCPTLLIWGDLDTAVPLKRAYELEKLIKDSAVIVYENTTHYAYLERLPQISIVLDTFFKS